MNRMNAVVVAAVFLGLALACPAAQAQSPRKVKLTMPVVALTMSPVYLAKGKGFFAEEGLDVEITSTGGGGPDIRALIAGEADFTFTTGDNVIMAYQEGKPLVMVTSALNKVFKDFPAVIALQIKGNAPLSPVKSKPVKAFLGLYQIVVERSNSTSFIASGRFNPYNIGAHLRQYFAAERAFFICEVQNSIGR